MPPNYRDSENEMFAFWVALAATCGALVFGILVTMPWVPSTRNLTYGIAVTVAFFAAVLGRQMAYTMRPELFEQGAPNGAVITLQGLVFGLGLAAVILSLAVRLIRHAYNNS